MSLQSTNGVQGVAVTLLFAYNPTQLLWNIHWLQIILRSDRICLISERETTTYFRRLPMSDIVATAMTVTNLRLKAIGHCA